MLSGVYVDWHETASNFTACTTPLAVGDDTECVGKHVVTQAEFDAGAPIELLATAHGVGSGFPVRFPDESDPPLSHQVEMPSAVGISVDLTRPTETYSAANDIIPFTVVISNVGNVTVNTVAVDWAAAGLSRSGPVRDRLVPMLHHCPATRPTPWRRLTCRPMPLR